MPGVPPCSLCKKVKAYFVENKKSFLIYSIFYVLVAEILSYFLRYEKDYACYYYPLLSQLEFFLILFSIYLWNDRLHFCFRKNLAVLFLSGYFLFGFLAVLFKVQDSFYTSMISLGLIGISALTFFLSIFKSE